MAILARRVSLHGIDIDTVEQPVKLLGSQLDVSARESPW